MNKKTMFGIILLGIALCIATCIVGFEKVVINYRPVILDEGLEASYPSSHTMLAVAFICAAISQFSARLKNPGTRKIVLIACAVDGIGVIICRVLAGVHWITDIIGAILIAGACFFLYYGIFKIVLEKKNKKSA